MNFRALQLIGLMAFVLAISSACTTSLTNMSPARTMKAGEAQVATGYQFDVHTQAATSIYKAGEAAVDEVRAGEDDEVISEETLRTFLDAALMWRLFPIGGGPEFMARVGLYDDLLEGFDAGFRYNGSVFKGDLRWQLWASPNDAAALSIQAAYGHHRAFIPGILEWALLTRWKRKDFDFQVNLGYEFDDWAKLYLSPRYMVSHMSTEAQFAPGLRDRLPQRFRDWDPSRYFPPSTMHYVGANFGGMIGYRYAFVNLDITVFRTIYNPVILDSERDFSGWTVAPTAAITLMWR